MNQRRQPLERITAVALVALMCTLTLEWMTLGGAAGGTLKPFHLVATAFIGLVALRNSLTGLCASILRRFGVIYVAWTVYLLIATAFSRFHVDPYANSKDLIRSATYSFSGLVVAGYLMRNLHRERVRRVLTWAGVAACIVLTVGLYTSLRSQGGSAISTIQSAITHQDPDIIGQQLLKTAFESNQEFEDAKVNLRHKIASALLLGVFTALAFRSHLALRTLGRRILFWGSVAYGFGVVVFTFSRSITIALGIVLGLNGLRVLLSGRARPAHGAAVAAVLVASVATVLSPVGGLLYTRFFEETDSYSGRVDAIGLFLEDAPAATFMGADYSQVQAVPHNAILDAWLSAGVIGFALATLALGSLIAVWLRELARYLAGSPGWVLPVHQFWVLAMGVTPLVRAFTAANGFHLTEWTSVGVFLGCLEANRRHAAAIANEKAKERRQEWMLATPVG